MPETDISSHRGIFLIPLMFSVAASVALTVAASAVGSGLHVGRLGPPSEEPRRALSMLAVVEEFFFIPQHLTHNILAGLDNTLLLAYGLHFVFYGLIIFGSLIWLLNDTVKT